MVAIALPGEPNDRFVRAATEVTGGNPFFVGEVLQEAAANGLSASAAAASDIGALVPRGVANAALSRLARLRAPAAELARALSVLGDGAQVGDAARLAGLTDAEMRTAMTELVSAGVIESGGTVRFTHPILRTAIDQDLSPAERELRRAQSFGATRAIGIALRAQALVGPGGERTKRLEEAVAVLEPSPGRLEHARVLVDLGATFRAAGKRTTAREPLLEGLALAARCGALTLERRARAELAAIGVRPRSPDHDGADSLTPSERRVAEPRRGRAARTGRSPKRSSSPRRRSRPTSGGRF